MGFFLGFFFFFILFFSFFFWKYEIPVLTYLHYALEYINTSEYTLRKAHHNLSTSVVCHMEIL